MKGCKYFAIPLLLFLLTGCLYPNSQLDKNQIPVQNQIERVQNAVDQYQKNENGLLPIKTRDQDTPIFQKYQIDFERLKQQNLIGEIPGSAFENGGYYQYVIITPEKDPTVKLLDLRTTDTLRSLQVKVEFYQNSNRYPPLGEQIAKDIYKLDYQKIGLNAPPVIDSPYSQQQLPVYIDNNGQLLIDYRKDLYQFIREKDHTYQSGDDIRYLLTDHAPFVPGYSVPYTIKDGEPIFMSEYKSS